MMSKIHHRMPVILQKDNYENWFISKEREEIELMMTPLGNEEIVLERA